MRRFFYANELRANAEKLINNKTNRERTKEICIKIILSYDEKTNNE